VQNKGQVGTPRECKKIIGTHFLSSAKQGTSQDTKRLQESKKHSQASNHRVWTNQGTKKKRKSERHLHTNNSRGRQVRILRESERAKGTNLLLTTEEGTGYKGKA